MINFHNWPTYCGTNIKCSAYQMKILSKCDVWKYIQGMYLLQYLKIKYLALQEDWASVLVIEWALSFKSLVKRTWIGTISISIVYVLTYDQPLCTISIGSVPWFSDKNCVFEVSSFMFDLPSIYHWIWVKSVLFQF